MKDLEKKYNRYFRDLKQFGTITLVIKELDEETKILFFENEDNFEVFIYNETTSDNYLLKVGTLQNCIDYIELNYPIAIKKESRIISIEFNDGNKYIYKTNLNDEEITTIKETYTELFNSGLYEDWFLNYLTSLGLNNVKNDKFLIWVDVKEY